MLEAISEVLASAVVHGWAAGYLLGWAVITFLRPGKPKPEILKGGAFVLACLLVPGFIALTLKLPPMLAGVESLEPMLSHPMVFYGSLSAVLHVLAATLGGKLAFLLTDGRAN
jgi:hypothetical protein